MPLYHLSKDAAQAPDVHSCGVVFAAQKDFRCSVPQGHHLGTKIGRVRGGVWGMEIPTPQLPSTTLCLLTSSFFPSILPFPLIFPK